MIFVRCFGESFGLTTFARIRGVAQSGPAFGEDPRTGSEIKDFDQCGISALSIWECLLDWVIFANKHIRGVAQSG